MTEHAILPLDRRLWWPEAYLDEEMPEGRGTPSAWLMALNGGAYACGDREDDAAPPFTVQEGEIITFVARDSLGRTVCSFEAAGVDIWTPAPPVDVSLWCSWTEAYDVLADGPADFSKILRANHHPEPGERITVNVARWHDDGFRFRFTSKDGPPRFIPLDPLPEVGPALPEIVREDRPDLFASPVA